eukprot:2333875-Prymnesium_polylepis.1
MGEDARAEAPGGLPLRFWRAARSPQRRRGPSRLLQQPDDSKTCCSLPSGVRALGRCSGPAAAEGC